MPLDKDKYNDAYEKGYSEGKKGDYYSDLEHSNSNWHSGDANDSSHSYDEGYADGIKDRNKWGDKEKGKEGCFITTACVKHKGLSDTTIELQILRNFRDTYIRNLPRGEELIQLYYIKSPQIVRRISQLEYNKRSTELDEIYMHIQLACRLIKLGNYEQAFELYCNIVIQLDKKYTDYE